MNITIKGTNIELTPAIRDYVEKKVGNLEKFISKHGDNALVEVEVGKTTQHHQKGDIFRAEINLSLAGNAYQFRADAETTDLYAAIDLAHDEMEVELNRFKGKRESRYRRGAKTLKNLIKRFWA
jgi:putative sigma-54 modulation protein